jgi:hypothetical protein
MSDNTNGRFVSPCPPPTAHESEVLTILIEEAAEVQQRATKMLRFGVKEMQPGQSLSNRARLSDEVGDLMAIIDMAKGIGLIDTFRINKARAEKFIKLDKYMQTNPETGK